MEVIIKETDPRAILQVSPQGAIDEGFSALERRVRKLAELKDYDSNPQGLSMAQYLSSKNVISPGTLKIWEILKNLRDQAMYAKVDPDSARKYLDLLDPEFNTLDKLIVDQTGKQNGKADA